MTSAASILPSMDTSDTWIDAGVAGLSRTLTFGASAFSSADSLDPGNDDGVAILSVTSMAPDFSIFVNVSLQRLGSQQPG